MSYFREVDISTAGPQKQLIFKRLMDGTNDNMSVDGSTTEVVFKLSPPTGEVWRIASWNIYIQDSGTFDAEKWGNGIVMTNGIMPRVLINGTLIDMISFPIKTSGDLSSICDGINLHTFGTGNEIITAEWRLINNGQYLRLTDNDEIQLVIRDDLTNLVNQYTTVKGYIE